MAKPSTIDAIGEWGLPWRGNLRSLPAHEVPPDALWDSENMMVRDAILRPRNGLRRIFRSVPDTVESVSGIATGAIWFQDDQRTDHILVGTSTGVYRFNGFIWRKLTTAKGPDGTAPNFLGELHGGLDNPSRFCVIEIGAEDGPHIYVLHTNGVDPVMYWERRLTSMNMVKGDPVGPEDEPGPPKPCPRFTTMVHINDHIIGTVPPYDIRWGNRVGNPDNILSKWPELNFRALSDTPDPLVCIEALGTLGAAVYKTDTLWACFFQGGSEASAFRFEFRGWFDGPAGPAAVVNVSGMHFYMTHTGRIGRFNGSQHSWVADGVWPQLRDRISPSFSGRTFGVYNAVFHEILFFYVRNEDTDGLPRGLVLIALPNPDAGRGILGAFPGHLSPLWGGSVTAALAFRMGTKLPRVGLFDASAARTIYDLDDSRECSDDGLPVGEAKDNGEPFDFFWQPGLASSPGRDVFRLDAIEHFMERNANYGTLDFNPIRSYNLAYPGGEVGPKQLLDLSQQPVRPLSNLDMRGRFHSCRYSHTPTIRVADGGPGAPYVRWSGGIVYGHRIEGQPIPRA